MRASELTSSRLRVAPVFVAPINCDAHVIYRKNGAKSGLTAARDVVTVMSDKGSVF